MATSRRDTYTKRMSMFYEQLAAVENDLKSASRQVDRQRLGEESENIWTEIENLEHKLKKLGAGNNPSESSPKGSHQWENELEQKLRKIDFNQAKKAARSIQDKLNKNGGAVLLFLQKSKKQMGHYCVEEVIDVFMSDRSRNDTDGAYRRYSVNLGSPISQCNEVELLNRLASLFGIKEVTDAVSLSEQIRYKIKSSINIGSTIFIEIKGLDDLLEQERFLEWWIEEFWKPLTDEMMAVSRQYRSRFIVALIANSQILHDCSSVYFCKDESFEEFDSYKILELLLPNWTPDDIQDWLYRFYDSSPAIKGKTPEELEKIAKDIHRDSEGTPESVCVSLRELFAA